MKPVDWFCLSGLIFLAMWGLFAVLIRRAAAIEIKRPRRRPVRLRIYNPDH
jgi:hypothetical protein